MAEFSGLLVVILHFFCFKCPTGCQESQRRCSCEKVECRSVALIKPRAFLKVNCATAVGFLEDVTWNEREYLWNEDHWRNWRTQVFHANKGPTGDLTPCLSAPSALHFHALLCALHTTMSRAFIVQTKSALTDWGVYYLRRQHFNPRRHSYVTDLKSILRFICNDIQACGQKKRIRKQPNIGANYFGNQIGN